VLLLQESSNDKLGIVTSEANCPTARTMDGVLRQLTLWTRTGSDIKRKSVKYKNRKAPPRMRAPPARAPPAPRSAVRVPGAASKASLRRMAKDEAPAAATSVTMPPRAPRPAKAEMVRPSVAKAKEGKPGRGKREAAKKRAEDDEVEDTEEDVDEEAVVEDDPIGLTVIDEGDPEVCVSPRLPHPWCGLLLR
jgi:hypothetical protein